jgi:PAS domain-containing protein
MIQFIKQKWSDALNIGRKNNIHYLELQRIALLNAVAVISLFLSFTITAIYYSLGFSNKFVPLIMIPICFSVLWCNKIGKYRLAKNIAFLGFLISITFWSFYTRRSGAELFFITLACSSASIFKRKNTVFASMFVCGIFYFSYAIYDNIVPFKIDPTINYFFINTLLTYTTAGVVFFQIILFVDLTNHFSKSLDKKYDELNFAFDKQKGTEDKLKNSNIELLSFNNKLDQLVKKSNSELHSYQTAINDNLYSIVTDLDGTILKINDNFINACGYSKAELLGKNFTILNSDFHSENFYKSISERIDAGKVWRGEPKTEPKTEVFSGLFPPYFPFLIVRKTLFGFLQYL